MQTSSMQMFIFVQSLLLKIKFPDMELARNARSFRSQYKKSRGLPNKATALEVLTDVVEWYKQNLPEEIVKIKGMIAQRGITL